ncbi:MAG TPA: 4-oxalomesaconate tautomerase [Steroidobacteraceae bacterium]|jgi:4-oxalomesaconate tautomerase|nr:4-oxalomesaconate tautomerase [Steroidobacteraceae bacterium]
MQRSIPCLFMRGGTSRGPFFVASDLPADAAERDRVLLAAMGSPDPRQIDGVGGADPLTSKVGIVRPGRSPGTDLEFLFAQVSVKEARVDTTPNCGNMLAAVVPFAIETGLVPARGNVTTLRVLTRNTGTLSDIEVQTPGGAVEYAGEARIDGVPGTAAPINISFLDTEGSVCGALLPTGKPADRIDGVEVTCIDNGMPVVVMAARDLGVSGYETRDELNANTDLKRRIEAIRLLAGPLMRLGDVAAKVVPKMCLVAAPRAGGHLSTRTFIPHDCHAAVGVLGAVTVATAAVMPGTVANRLAVVPPGVHRTLSVEHPSGEFSVRLRMSPDDPTRVLSAALLRTARLIMRGEIFVPSYSKGAT